MVDARIETLSPTFTRQTADIDVRVGGQAEVFRQIGTTVEKDLAKAESVAIPITLILLVLVFGSVVAAGAARRDRGAVHHRHLPRAAPAGRVHHVSIFALNLTTAMGLGLAIDYSLFVVSRFREELRTGSSRARPWSARSTPPAARSSSARPTVAASLAALLVFPLAFLRSFAYAGIAVVAMAALSSVVVLPAALAALGHRIDKWRCSAATPSPWATASGTGWPWPSCAGRS